MSTLDTIKSILEDKLSISPDLVNEDSTFKSLGVDSLDMIELICTIEEELDVELGEPEGLETIGDCIKYVESL